MEKIQNNTVRLLRRWQKGLFNLLFSRTTLVVLLLLLQIGMLLSTLLWLEDFLLHILGAQFVIIFCMVLHLLNSGLEPAAKITWLLLIMATPLFGSLLYLYSLRDIGHRALRKYVKEKMAATAGILTASEDTLSGLDKIRPGAAAMTRYVYKNGGYPVFQNTNVTYFPSGEEKLQQLLSELEKAEKFIFLEYFIIEEGTMWGQILDVLIRKAAEGIDVRILYDGTCEFMLLPKGYAKKLASLGIQCKVFSPFIPFLSTHYNYRDHRKIAVIDGHTAFTGGINLADEYINARPKFGHWKDTAVMLKGDAAKGFSLMFLQNWTLSEKNADFSPYLPPANTPAEGFVMPFGDHPMDSQQVGKLVYMDMLSRAQKTVCIMTPYLILDSETENALKYAAERGVCVKLILPGIPDKKLPYALAKTHYAPLLEAGVEIYEYTPGFVHAKVFLCDEIEAVVGTINLDYRSLYHHFECATYLCGGTAPAQIADDFFATLMKCRQIDREALKKISRRELILGKICKPFAPLL
ncbi:MAG: PLDc N-terminal domain-containing protein [Oscillospiraceae bacterium]|nr:PLDc N-terminal domain-containing protein [Oscillospiraceae bacterium]